jgi:sulfite dehydrogenase (quinone) subunit SoeB
VIAWLKALWRGTGASDPAPSTSARAAVAADGRCETTLARQLALVIDLDVCVGCHACVTSCKSWNTQGAAGPLHDENPYGADPTGTFFNRVHTW